MTSPTPTITPATTSTPAAVRRSPRRALTAAVALVAAAGLGAGAALVVPQAITPAPTLTVRLYADDATPPVARVTVAGLPAGSGAEVQLRSRTATGAVDCAAVDWSSVPVRETRRIAISGDHPQVLVALSGGPGCAAVDGWLVRDGLLVATTAPGAPGALGTTARTSSYTPAPAAPRVRLDGDSLVLDVETASADGRIAGVVDYTISGPVAAPSGGCQAIPEAAWTAAPRVLRDSTVVPADIPHHMTWVLDPGCYRATWTITDTDGTAAASGSGVFDAH